MLLRMDFKKAHGAPVAWEKLKRSHTTKRAGNDERIRREKEARCPHLHFHIFASLPGLNGPANNRHRFKLLMNVDFLNYYRIQKKQGGVRLICLVKDLNRLRLHRLNHFDTHYLPRSSPRPRQALESFRQTIHKQR